MDKELASSQTRRDLYLDLSAATPSATARSRARSFSQALPSLRVSTSPTSLSPPPISPSGGSVPGPVNKARAESRKLLAHLLSRLKARPQAPSVYDSITGDTSRKTLYRLGAAVESVRSVVRIKGPREFTDSNTTDREEDDAVDNDQDYSTDVTYNYMSQLRDVLILSDRQGWQIFQAMDAETGSQRESSSLRQLRRNSAQFGLRSRSPSPGRGSQPPDLLLECIDIIASIISEDCRFRMSSSRVFRPPYGLQSVSLDIAQFLIKTHRHNAKILSRLGFAVIPAFASFNAALHTRLLAFFEDGILRGMLEDLQKWQGLEGPPTKDTAPEHVPDISTPVVAIQVDEAADDLPSATGQRGWLQWSSTSTPTLSNFLSTVAPSQPLVVYHLSSLVPSLLAAILETIDPFETDIRDIPKLHRFNTLLRTIVASKRDAYLDVLEVVAYHGPTTRRKALAVLATFWPKATGHVVIGKSLPIISFADALPNQTLFTKLQYARPERDHPYAHEFMPWRFSHAQSSNLDYGVLHNCCQACSGSIVGFGLFCPFCCVSVHLNCYDAPDGTFHGQYSISDTDHRQCFLSFSNVLPPHKDVECEIVKKAQHTFRMANLFTLALCLVCQKPLWGHVAQGMKCSTCRQFVHSGCLASASPEIFPRCRDFFLSSSHVGVNWTVLRQTFVDHYREILLPKEELSKKTYEEISIYYSVLWIQLRILDNGVVYKSIVVNQSDPKTAPGKENDVDEFELQYFVRLYEAYLSSGRLPMSLPLQEYHEFNKHTPSNEHAILFDWPLLANITSIIKTPLPAHPPSLPTPSNLLHVNDHELDDSSEPPSHPYELSLLSHMRDALGHEFQVHSDYAARYMLSHIRQVGFFDRTDSKSGLFDAPAPSEVFCSFALPSGLDLSTSVETLVVAIDSCLRDIDITVNEYGFLLLVRRFWPTGAASEYALTRLTKIVLSWIFAEDDRLVVIARDHIAYNFSLPGVRTATESPPWPSGPGPRQPPKTAVNSGGEYVLCRKQLLTRHAIPWLASVHDLDALLYTNSLYDHCVDMADASESRQMVNSLYPSMVDPKSNGAVNGAWGEVILRSIIKLAQANVTFSSFESILIRWFDSVTPPGTLIESLIFKSLPRLFNREADTSRRTSTMLDAALAIPDTTQIDPWRIFVGIASENADGLERSLSWLRVMAYSAVDIPPQVLKQLFSLTRDFQAPFSMTMSLLESTMASTWLKTFGSEGLEAVMVEVNTAWADYIIHKMQSEAEADEVLHFLRYSLVSCLLVYGCDRQAIASLGLIRSEELRFLSHRRKVTTRVSAVPATLDIDPRLVTILSRYAAEGHDSACAIVAKFLNVLISESALLESHEIDQFILVNGDALSQCAWRFYDIHSQEISEIRTSFLLRLLVVDPQPFDTLLCGILRPGGKWQLRFQGVTRLFRIILDVNSPSFSVEGRQWKSSVIDVINHFFQALWMDGREEIRLAVDTWARTLLPAHMHVISSCWDEYMSKAPIADRARLAAFLVQLHPHFPSWHLMSWETIVEVLLDDDFVQSNGEDEDGYAAAAHLSVYGYPSPSGEQARSPQHDDSDIVALRVSLMILSLQMIAAGVAVDLVNILKIKLILAKVLGFSSTSLRPAASGQVFHVHLGELDEIPHISFPCVNLLMRVLDAPHQFHLPPSSMGVTWNDLPVQGLIGDMFVDVLVRLWENTITVQSLPYPILRGLLESVLLIIIKHELNGPCLKHLDEMMCRAVKTVTDLVALDSSYDIRHLCLAVMRAFMQGYPALALRILGHQVLVLTRLVASLRFNADDSLVVQARGFLEAAFIQYEVSGLFWLLSKQGRMSDDFFVMLRHVVSSASGQTAVPGEILRDSIVRDTLSKVAANASDRAIPDVLANLEKYVAACHHQSYPTSLIQHIGLRLTAVARQTADSTSTALNRSSQVFDPNPLLLMSATIVQHNKAQSVDLLLHTETLLRSSLARFEVHADTLNRLLHVTSTMYRRSKTVDVNGSEFPTNHIAMGVLDVLSDSLRGKIRPMPSTLNAMVEAVMSLHKGQSVDLPTSTVLRAGADAIMHLSSSSYREAYGQTEFAASLAIANLVLHASVYDANFLSQCLSDVRTPVRVWNLIVLAGLKSLDFNISMKLLALLPTFAMAYVSSLRVPLSGVLNESAAPIVNHAFASVKLWMLMARKSCFAATGHNTTGSRNQDSDSAERMVWNELWPPFERLLVHSLADGPNGEMPPLLTFIWSCVSDLMLFVRQARSIVALDTSSHVAILNKLRILSRGEVAGGKFARALRSIAEPPADISFELLVIQVTSDVLAAEKLQALELYRQNGAEKRREHVEKRRVEARDFRTMS